MKHGVMTLVYNDEILRTRQYWGIQHRKDIVAYWRMFYGVKFSKCFIHLCPAVSPEAVNDKTGINMRFKKDISTVGVVGKYLKITKFGNQRKTSVSKPIRDEYS